MLSGEHIKVGMPVRNTAGGFLGQVVRLEGAEILIEKGSFAPDVMRLSTDEVLRVDLDSVVVDMDEAQFDQRYRAQLQQPTLHDYPRLKTDAA